MCSPNFNAFMPLQLNIDHLCLGYGADPMGEYIYLMDNSSPYNEEFVGGVRYIRRDTFLECKNMVSDGYGPTLVVLVAQEAARLGLDGASPDSNKNSAEALAMMERLASEPLPGLELVPTGHLQHPDSSLNVLWRVKEIVVDEMKASTRYETHQGKGWRGWLHRKRFPVSGVGALWLDPDEVLRFMKADYLRKSDEPFWSE